MDWPHQCLSLGTYEQQLTVTMLAPGVLGAALGLFPEEVFYLFIFIYLLIT